LQEAAQIADAAGRTDRVTIVEMTHRFYPPVQQAREWVRSGRMGRVFAVEDRIVQPTLPGDLPEWIFQRACAGGGVALTNGIHMLDRIAWVCGQELTYRNGVASWAEGQGDAEDTAAMVLSLEDGTPVSLLASWPQARGTVDHELTIYGTTGTLRVWAWQGWRFEPGEGDAENHVCYPEEADHYAKVRIGMVGVLREFSAAIREGRTASPSPAEVLKAQAIVEAFYEDNDATL
ncbi:MAG: Gfo/Idh/MocA family oxidoreductase, partial [Candidatus Latescibacteria bacterium]|nr:Gfo/Idh/MocA family oxidoreductase [Candidatus Latescibacterota bacterium]